MATETDTNDDRDFIHYNTSDSNLAEAALDLHTGMNVLIDAMSVLCKAIMNSESDSELMGDFSDMHWIALRLKNDIKDIVTRVDALPDAGAVAA